MDQKDLDFEQDLIDSELLLKNTARSMDDDAEYTLESILAEYGGDVSSAAPKSAPASAQKEAPADDPPPAGRSSPFPAQSAPGMRTRTRQARI